MEYLRDLRYCIIAIKEMKIKMKNLEKIDGLIGKTPLAKIDYSYQGREGTLYAKLEYYNLSGSVKDRMAWYILKKSYEQGLIKEGDTIVEATSGNTGIAFCALGAYTGNPVIIFMPDWMSQERKKLISSFGAKIINVSKEEGGFLGSIDLADNYQKDHDHVFLPHQFSNPLNTQGQYESLGKELVADLERNGLVCDGFVAGVGTGGVITGVAKAIKEVNKGAKAFPLEPKESPTLSTGYKVGSHKIAGISDEFIPDLVKGKDLDDIVSVYSDDAILMAQKLARRGLGVGISSGANFLGAILAAEILGQDKVVATIFSDDNKKYLSTDLMKDIPVEEDFISKDIEILDIQAI